MSTDFVLSGISIFQFDDTSNEVSPNLLRDPIVHIERNQVFSAKVQVATQENLQAGGLFFVFSRY